MLRSRSLPGLIIGLGICLGSCTGGEPASSNPDRLVVAVSTLSESTFLPWNGSTGRKIYLDTIYEYLVYIDPETGDLQPGLAERWEVSADGKLHTLWLRPGVKFQKGWGEVTAEDVKFSLEKMISPEAIAGPTSVLRTMIESVDAPARYRIDIALRKPDIRFVRGYLSNGLIVAIVSKAYFDAVGDDAANAAPVGSGAYELGNVKKDVFMELSLRDDADNLWRVRPDFRELEFVAAPEEFTRVAMLKTGEADLAAINFDSINYVEEAGLDVLFLPHNWSPVVRFGGLSAMFYDPDNPWADRRVRLAMNYAIDKSELIDTIFHGQAIAAGTDSAMQELFSVEPFPYDPARAKQLLAEAGYPDGFDVRLKTFTTNPGAELPVVAQIVALYWQAIGIRTTIEPTNWIGLRSAWTTGNATDVVWTHRGFPWTTPLVGFQSSYSASSVFASYSDDVVPGMLEQMNRSTDLEERKALALRLATHLREQGAEVYLAHVNEPYGISKKVDVWPTISQQVTNIDRVRRRAMN